LSKELKKREERWSPDEVLREFDSMLDDFKRNFMAPWMPMRMRAWEGQMKMPRLDMDDHGDHYEVNIEVPGVSNEAVQVHVNKNSLEVQAELEEEKRDEKRKNFLVRERNHSEIYRRMIFPEEIIPEDTEATVANGLLKITAPKKYKPEEKRRIEVKSA
jgi:HSP20 family protein